MHLEPFDLSQTEQFLHAQGIKLNQRQILQLFIVTGGVPYYLSQMDKGLSAIQIIEQLAFSKDGFLLNEFNNLFSSLFENGEDYITIVKSIAQFRYGIGERALLEKLGKNMVGSVGKKKLKELEQTGFIQRFKPLYHEKKGHFYRLSDQYTSFYLKWIAPLADTLQKESLSPGYWSAIITTPEWYSWLGYAYESVCYKHIAKIRLALNLSPTAIAGTWRYVPNKKSGEHGGQIDLLFDRKDDAITICEIKYTDEPFILTKEYLRIIQQKIDVFKKVTRTKKQLFIAFISANGLKENFYSEEFVSACVKLEDLF